MTKNNMNEVLLIGLPNSGKSSLVNALCRKKVSIIGSTPNTTRDKVSSTIKRNEKTFNISDLPGYLEDPDELNEKFQKKLKGYLNSASMIMFVIDVNTTNFTGLDKIHNLLQTTLKEDQKIITVFNKCENFKKFELNTQLYKYIYDADYYVSSIHKLGTEELLDSLTKNMSSNTTSIKNTYKSIAIIGKPNSGKSTLFNKLLNEERAIVSSISGTTRDKLEETIQFDSDSYNIIDTAGVPRKKQKNQIDRYASSLAVGQLENSVIAFLVVDATQGINFEDMRLISECVENKVTPVLIMNKWDLLIEDEKLSINKNITSLLKKYSWLKILRISALNGKGVKNLNTIIFDLQQQLSTRITTHELNILFREIWTKKPPHPFRGRRAKLKYVTQYDVYPPSFSFILSSRVPINYQNFIDNRLRDTYNFDNICLNIKFKT
ncbi:ribosome biogenesis GTPase Der [bacterium]|jgi:GTP-binding protein|nr:ribosome biogenesis GTPase Der [Candidatus Actinomarina sp.]MDA9681441.1 ribosome biogenesis GTPase Der [bacterium]MDC1071477.1 ribosome biogenesis GTPase Der [Acidimicrobiia bacterium]|tara:strand:+ start:1503 stop:2807 length:1305 start_codon:yes stop_codon:yes gene_type:complete